MITLIMSFLWTVPLTIALSVFLPKELTSTVGFYALCFAIGSLGYLITGKLRK